VNGVRTAGMGTVRTGALFCYRSHGELVEAPGIEPGCTCACGASSLREARRPTWTPSSSLTPSTSRRKSTPFRVRARGGKPYGTVRTRALFCYRSHRAEGGRATNSNCVGGGA
jgi:hypothetical protein